MVVFAACAACLACTAPARGADLLTMMLNDYVNNQKLDPCKYTPKQLRGFRGAITNDAAAYAAGLGAAIDDALARRAEGACNQGGATGAAPPAATAPPPPPPASTAPPASPQTPGAPAAAQPPPTPATAPVAAPDVAAGDAIRTATHATDPATDAPFPLLALAVLAGVLALGAALVGVVRWLAWEPAWAERFRHAAGEAGWRASSTWAEFTDFVRFGR
jgi:hypothetical protein